MSCTYYEFKSSLFGGDYWCDKKNCEVDEDTYYKYCRDYNFRSCPIYKKDTSSSGCYISTIVCNILKRSDDDKVLNNLRGFRDNVLQKNEEYFEILKCYDTMGPVLAQALFNDKERDIVAKNLYDNILTLISHQIETKDYDKAVCNYKTMTIFLISYYGLGESYLEIRDNDYGYPSNSFDPTTAGHGKRRTLTNNC